MDNLNNLVLKSANNGALLGEGSHSVTIAEVSPSMPKGQAFNDPTPQLKIVYKDANGKQFTEWYNTKGYQRYEDLSAKDKQSSLFGSNKGYAVVLATGARVEDPARTESALNILNKVGHDAGIEAGKTFQPIDLIGRKLVIQIGASNDGEYNNLRVKGTRPVSAMVDASEV